jgi:acyl-CoA synthetase (AMP-forming)/AMP-acid ligase II
MRSLLERIETQIISGNDSASFTFYADDFAERRRLALDELRREALRIAGMLPRSATVLIVQPDPLEFITSFFGCLYAGAIAVPLALPTRRHGLEHLEGRRQAVGARHCLTNSSVLERLRRWYGEELLGNDLTWIATDPNLEAGLAVVPTYPDPSDIALVQFTSGSTGIPKAIAVSHENIVENSKLIQGCFGNRPESVSVCWLPNYHDMGLIDGIIQPVFSGFHGVLVSPTSFLQRPVRWLRAISEYRATYSGGPNFAFDHCVERITDEELSGVDLSSLDCLYNGSERVVGATLRRFADRFANVGFSMNKFVPCYGLAEATLAVTASGLNGGPVSVRANREAIAAGQYRMAEDGVELIGCGKPLGETEVRILDAATSLELPPGEIGEICVAGKSVAKEYGSPLDGSRFVVVDGKRILRTGDLGCMIDGELFVTGRLKDVIIIRGRNHDPAGIERTSFTSHQALAANSAAAFSMIADEVEQLVLIQEVRRTFSRGRALVDVIDSIVAAVSETHGVVPYDVGILLPGTLPKTTSGKIQRGKCRDMFTTNQFDVIASLRGRTSSQNA